MKRDCKVVTGKYEKKGFKWHSWPGKPRYTILKPLQLLKTRINSGDHQKSIKVTMFDEVLMNKTNCFGFRKKTNKKKYQEDDEDGMKLVNKGGAEGSVILLLTKNPPTFFSCPSCQVHGFFMFLGGQRGKSSL